MSAILTLTDVGLRIGAATLLDDISLSISASERIALIGPNGAGKSSLLRILSGELHPSHGSAALLGRPLSAYAPAELAECRAVLSQQITVAFPFRVAEIVAMGARGASVPDTAIDAALNRVGLADFADRIVTTLSGGEQQRAHIARVLIQTTFAGRDDVRGLILLDEPTASLDLRHQLDLAEIVTDCAERGFAVVSILHDLNLVPLFADRVIALDHGRLVGDGSVGSIITEQMIRQIFNIAGAVGRTPPEAMPFVLPQSADQTRSSR